MADVTGGGNNPAIGIAVYAALIFDIISEACSSPQTAEINIGTREETLMKWVYVGMLIGAAFILVGIAASPEGKKKEPIIGGGLAMVIVWAQYTHAKASGLANGDQPGTEQQYG